MKPFASRTDWNLAPNRLAQLAGERRRAGLAILDLTESNPTRCQLDYDRDAILRCLADPRDLDYSPDPRGLVEARAAVSEYYAAWGAPVHPDRILLTSGTSEAYAHLFRLLAEPGSRVLAPQPSYPLLEFLSRLNDLELAAYRIEYDQGWRIDFASLERAADDRARALVVIQPNNPTGSLLQPDERPALIEFAASRGLALIVDEVFLDYCLPEAAARARTLAGEAGALTFVLNGLSKTAALPQMKVGWIAASGPPALLREALDRLEVILDTYLAVGTPAQRALPQLLACREPIQRRIRERLFENLRRLDAKLARQSLCSRLELEGGWSVVLRLPRVRTDQQWAEDLLEKDGLLTHPGHFFDFEGEAYLALSLLVPAAVLDEGTDRILARVAHIYLDLGAGCRTMPSGSRKIRRSG